MELSRSEYPGIVSSVHPTPAVKILRDRLQRVQTLNLEIADWLQERRRVEEAYAQGLNKLAKRTIQGDGSDLGVFQGPWTRIASSTTALATSHQEFAQRIDTEVERPLRDFTNRNAEWSGMKNMEMTLAAAAKSVDQAEEKSEKIKRRGQKAKHAQVAEAAKGVESANSEWESQAPFAFEKFQAADESRCNHLRDVLTTWQTLELDQAQRNMQAAEATLNAILDINTNDEIKGFANKVTAGKAKIERLRSRTGSSGGPPVPGSSLGLKRLGTVLRGRNRNSSIPYFRSASPDKRPGSNGKGGPGRGLLGLMPPSPASPSNNGLSPEHQSTGVSGNATPPRPSTGNGPPPTPTTSGESRPETATTLSESNQIPGAVTPSVTVTASEPQTDAEGYTIPPPIHDIGQSSIPDEATDEQSQPQFKVEIKNDVIHEEEEEADAALSKVTSTLRAQQQNTVSRRTRGRRDASQVRNTMFIPNPQDFETPSSPPLTPIKYTPKSSNAASECASDTLSIRSSRSITSLTNSQMRHPDLNELGLSASLIEAISMSFENGVPLRTQVTGEIAVAYNPHDTPSHPITEILRIDNFNLLEKVAPNPAFITAVPDHVAEYSLSLANIHRTSVAFKYQIHVDENNMNVFAPIIVNPVWRIEPHQSSVIVHWKPNPVFRRLNGVTGTFTMKNVIFSTGVEGAATSSCQSKPAGAFSRERGRLVWKLGDVSISPEDAENGAKKVVARFATDSQARNQPVDVRWEISGEDSSNVGSGIALSVKDKAETVPTEEKEPEDPFADAEVKSMVSTDVVIAGGEEWKGVVTARKVVSGKYVANQHKDN
ncbi:Muniscin C-terminal mu homology domain-containing protein [Morchella snyderi]|nr:Muniscin C-terminal mu homology domain-containing protein [Morchella snyderi]